MKTYIGLRSFNLSIIKTSLANHGKIAINAKVRHIVSYKDGELVDEVLSCNQLRWSGYILYISDCRLTQWIILDDTRVGWKKTTTD